MNADGVQALIVAKTRFGIGETESDLESLDNALDSSKRILGELVEDAPTLRRSSV